MSEEDIELAGAEARNVGAVRPLAWPPVDPVRAVTPIDGERPAEKSEDPTRESNARASRDVGHVVGQSDRCVAFAMLGEREVIVVVAVDEPQLGTVDGARGVDGGEEAWSAGMIGEVPEVADLDDERAALLGRHPRQCLDPRGVAVGVAGDEDATNVVS